jgi:putative peptide zinc metalloprotease protein
MGAGVYLVWPVFYTDVTDSYRLSRRGRLRTDLGGVYFNALFALAVTGLHGVTGFRPLLLFVVLAHVETARQFLPFVRLDGYYVVGDLAGVPNLFAYMRPVLTSLLPWHDGPARVAARAKLDELTPRARRLVTGWVCLTAPVLLVNVVVLLVLAPRLAGAAWVSAAGQLATLRASATVVDPVGVVYGAVGLLLLALPILGVGFIIFRSMRHLARGARIWWQRRPATTAAIGAVAATLVALQVVVVWPDAFADARRHGRPEVPDGPHAELAGPILGDARSRPPAPVVKPPPTTGFEAAAGPYGAASHRVTVPPPTGGTRPGSGAAPSTQPATAGQPATTRSGGGPTTSGGVGTPSPTSSPPRGRRGTRGDRGPDPRPSSTLPSSTTTTLTSQPTLDEVLADLFAHG